MIYSYRNVQAAWYIQGQCWIYYIELPTFYQTTGMFLGKRKKMKSCAIIKAIINLWRNNFSVSFLWSKSFFIFFIINLWLTLCAFNRKAFMKHQISCWFGMSKHIDTSKKHVKQKQNTASTVDSSRAQFLWCVHIEVGGSSSTMTLSAECNSPVLDIEQGRVVVFVIFFI